jgi:teichuronic acid biosynthesis glycosyltransferase TuaC
MRLLIVCSGNTSKDQHFDLKIHQAFIYEQVESLKLLNVECDYFLIRSKGLLGYLKHFNSLKKALQNNYDLIHAHNGLCGFIANLQREIPVITTFHGSDINLTFLRLVSYFPLWKSSYNIFVSAGQLKKVLFRKKIDVIPCAVDTKTFFPMVDELKYSYNISENQKKIILFSSSFCNNIKNYPLAIASIKKLNTENIELLELKNKSRNEVCLLMNTSNLLLLTSFSEGSPQVIKEAMACNCPIVSTDVGDVREIIGDTEGCYITTFDPSDIAEKISLALQFSQTKGRTNGRERIIKLGLDTESIAKRIFEVYMKILNKTKKDFKNKNL